MFAAIRFGPLGAAGTAVVSMFLAGPLLSSQPVSDWTTRGIFFLVIGQVMALLVHEPAAMRLQKVQILRTDRAGRAALARGELELHYQPIVDIQGRRNRIVGAEALLRWKHPRQGLISGAPIIEAAEASGFIHELGDWTFAEVCERVAQWTPLVDEPFIASVNVSACELEHDGFVDRVAATLERTGVQARRIYIEITETAVMADIARARERMLALNNLGIRFAIDDFGTGHSSLSYIRLLPIDVVKIDGSFITKTTEDPLAADLVSSIIELAHTIKLRTVAEWVATKEQADFLRSVKCDFVQGFHLGGAIAPPEITAALEAQRAGRRSRRDRQREMRPVA